MDRPFSRVVPLAGVVALAFTFAPVRLDAPLAGRSELAKLATAAKDLATKGREPELNELLQVLAELKEDPATLAKLREACSKSLAKVKAPATGAAVANVARGLRGVATTLSRQLATLDDQGRGALAELILRVDDDQPLAHQALSHVLKDGRWQSEDWTKILARRGEIQEALAKSRRLEVKLEAKSANFKPLAAIDASPAFVVAVGGVEVYSTMDAAKLERIVRSACQATALASYVRGFNLEVPSALKKVRRRYVLVTSKEQYLKAVDLALAAKAIPDEDVAHVRGWSAYIDKRDFYLSYDVSEVAARAGMLFHLLNLWLDEAVQPCLMAGFVNWHCLTSFGTTMPLLTIEPDKSGAEEGRTTDRPRNLEDEQQARQLAEAGLSGARRWLLFKASRGEDPAWSNSFVDQIGKLLDLDLLKSTFVVEYLQELGTFDSILRGTMMKEGEKRTRADVMETEISEGLAWFEQRFHDWLLPRGRAIVQRLEDPPPGSTKLTKDEQASLTELDRIRASAWDPAAFGPYSPAEFDRELTDGCAAHARYLKLHPAQLELWPDAHEEYAEKEGFTTEGCWAGMHSVIMPGADSAEDAIAGWMGTFYHRLPLLEPGLKRIGYSMIDGVAVLDASSLVEPDEREGFVLWPPREMKDVPLRFNAELPNPVPGADQSEWGYPITLQTTHKNVEVKLKLVRGGKPEGDEVDCHFSSPSHPTNLDCAPAGAFCLIPKSPLGGNARYTVVAEPAGGDKVVWSFTTGS